MLLRESTASVYKPCILPDRNNQDREALKSTEQRIGQFIWVNEIGRNFDFLVYAPTPLVRINPDAEGLCVVKCLLIVEPR